MKRTTIMLPEDLKVRAVLRARHLGKSLGEFIRDSLEAMLGRSGKGKEGDPLFTDEEVFDGPVPRDLAKHHDRYLYGERK